MCKTRSRGFGNTWNTCHFAAVNTSGIQWDRRNANDLMFNNHLHPLEICLGRNKKTVFTVHLYADRAASHRAPREKCSSSTAAPRRSYLALAFSLTLSWAVHIWCSAINVHTVNSFPRSAKHSLSPPPMLYRPDSNLTSNISSYVILILCHWVSLLPVISTVAEYTFYTPRWALYNWTLSQ